MLIREPWRTHLGMADFSETTSLIHNWKITLAQKHLWFKISKAFLNSKKHILTMYPLLMNWATKFNLLRRLIKQTHPDTKPYSKGFLRRSTVALSLKMHSNTLNGIGAKLIGLRSEAAAGEPFEKGRSHSQLSVVRDIIRRAREGKGVDIA